MTDTQVAFLVGTIVFGFAFSAVECARDLGYVEHDVASWRLFMATLVFSLSFIVATNLNL